MVEAQSFTTESPTTITSESERQEVFLPDGNWRVRCGANLANSLAVFVRRLGGTTHTTGRRSASMQATVTEIITAVLPVPMSDASRHRELGKARASLTFLCWKGIRGSASSPTSSAGPESGSGVESPTWDRFPMSPLIGGPPSRHIPARFLLRRCPNRWWCHRIREVDGRSSRCRSGDRRQRVPQPGSPRWTR